MAKELSPLQKAALDLMIEYKKVDDSFIGAIAEAFEDAGKAVANVATTIAHANPAVQAVITTAVGIAGAAVTVPTVGAMAQTALAVNNAHNLAGGKIEEAKSEGTAAAPANTTLEDLIKLRYGLR